MKKTGFATIILLILLTACKDDTVLRDPESVNSWIYNTMDEYYLWSATMPSKQKTDISLHPEDYFNDVLRYRHTPAVLGDDLFSYIKYTGSSSNYPAHTVPSEGLSVDRVTNFGFEVRISNGDDIYCQILSVVPGSPAWEAGVRRGDCFDRINGKLITSLDGYQSSMQAVTAELNFFYPQVRTITLRKSEYDDTPVLFDSIYDIVPRTGYIVYNHFTSGSRNQNFLKLKEVFLRFAQAGIKNLIVDLRYNGGGELTAAKQLASLIVPRRFLGDLFFYKERNGSYGDPDAFERENFLGGNEMAGLNPNISDLFFLTSYHTASASELLVHCLKPHMHEAGGECKAIGSATYGKNVGGVSITNRKYEWEIHPITLRVYDKYKVSGYEDGIDADKYVEEAYPDFILAGDGRYIKPIGGFGDVANERLLNAAMEMIYGPLDWAAMGGTRGVAAVAGRAALPGSTVHTRSARERSEYTITERGLSEGAFTVY